MLMKLTPCKGGESKGRVKQRLQRQVEVDEQGQHQKEERSEKGENQKKSFQANVKEILSMLDKFDLGRRHFEEKLISDIVQLEKKYSGENTL